LNEALNEAQMVVAEKNVASNCIAPKPQITSSLKEGDRATTKGLLMRTCKECDPIDCTINWVYFAGREGSSFKAGWYTEEQFKQIPMVLGSIEPIIFIHGTFSAPNTFTEDFKNNVISAIAFRGVTKSVSVEWSGNNDVTSRQKAAEGIVSQLKTASNQEKLKKLGMAKHIVLISHSHGGNVAKLIKNKLEAEGWRIDIVNIETPQRGDFQSNSRGNGVYINFYYSYDFVQQMGARSLKDWSFFLQSSRIDEVTLENFELAPNYITISELSQNIISGVYIWYLDSAGHGLHNNPIVQPQIIKVIQSQFKQKYR
jgi:hypothetical protein